MISPCCCGCEPRPEPVLRFNQSTLVEGGTAPYTRPYAFGSCAGTVGDVCQYQGFDAEPLSSSPPNTMSGIVGSSGGDMVSEIADNYFSNTGGETLSFDSHCTYGWKAVTAKEWWQGRWGFMSGRCCTGDVSGTVKYKTITETTTASGYCKNESKECGVTVGSVYEEFFTVTTTKTASVDEYGNITRSGSSVAKLRQLTDGVETYSQTWCDESHPGWTPTGLINFDHNIPGGDMTLGASCGVITVGGAGLPGSEFVPSHTGTAAELNALEIYPVSIVGYTNPCSMTPPDPTAEYQYSGTPIVFEVSDTRLKASWQVSGYGLITECCSDSPVAGSRTDATISYEKVVTLSGEETLDDVVTRAEALLGEFPLTDDRIYPWRTDAKTWLVPHITRDAAGREPTVASFDPSCEPLQDGSVYSGDIRGAPLPPGYGRFYNYYHKVVSAFIDGGFCSVNYDSDGELCASPLPISATQWTQKDEGADSRGHGAHIYTVLGGQFGSGQPSPCECVVVQKWAETLTKWPKYNAARPCARDRYLYDETAHVCGTLVGYDLTLDESATLSGKVAIDDGVYLITGGSGTAYTVGDRLYDLLIPNDGVAPMRFSTARGICSQIDCTVVQTSPGLVTVTCAGKHWLKRGGTESDTVTISGIGGLSSHTAAVTSDTEFTVSGTITGDILSGTVSQGGDPADDSTCSANTFIAREWTSRFREAALSNDPEEPNHSVVETEVTLAPIAKHPTVLYSSPNDSFPHGYSIPWGTIGSDMCYGNQWSATFEQAIADPLWQADHVPCPHSGAWQQRDNPCEAADANHYEFPPLVEATLEHSVTGGIPGAVGHPNCEIDPYSQGIAMSWRPGWLTCETWKEKVVFRC